MLYEINIEETNTTSFWSMDYTIFLIILETVTTFQMMYARHYSE